MTECAEVPAAQQNSSRGARRAPRLRPARGVRVAYLMSRFPKITETFILREMIELEKLGLNVEILPLRRENAHLVQPDAEPYVQRAHFTPLISWRILLANIATSLRQPWRYLTTFGTLMRANLGSTRYLAGAMLFFPKSVYFASEMRRRGIRHVHAHFASHPAAAAYVIRRLSGVPYSFVAHGSDLHRDQHMLPEKTREAAFVIAISNYNRDMILDECGQEFAEKVHVVHCGIDPVYFSPRTQPTPFDAGEGPFKIVCIGTLHEVKGQRFLIEACRILTERGLEVNCHFLGGGVDEQTLRERTERLGLNSRITFHGACSSEGVQHHLQSADALVAPSVLSRDGRREGIPVVLMEAMACAVPCVASRISGIPELVEDGKTGLLTPPGDAKAIADALERLAGEMPLRQQLGRASVEKVLREFSLPENTRALALRLTQSVQPAEEVQ